MSKRFETIFSLSNVKSARLTANLFLMQITPYRASEDRISGTIITFVNITQRKQSEEFLRFQAQLLNTVEQSVIATALDGTVTYWNRFAEQLYGWTTIEAVRRNVMELTMPEMMEEQGAEIMARLRQGESWSGEFNVQRKDGVMFPAQVSNSPVNDPDGKLIGIVGISFDLTARKRHEANLSFSCRFFTNLNSFGNRTGNCRKFRRKNEPPERGRRSVPFLPSTSQKMKPRSLLNGISRAVSASIGKFNIRELVSDEFQQAVTAGKTFVVRDMSKDFHDKGKKQLASLGIGSFVNMPLISGEWTLILGVYHAQPYDWRADELALLHESANRIWAKIESNRAEILLGESQDRLRLVIEAAEMGTWDWDLTTDKVNWNEQHFILFGMKPQKNPIAAENFFKHLYEDDRAMVTERLQKAIQEKSIFQAEFRARLDTGEIRWMEGYGKTVQTFGGKTTMMSGVMSDISDRKKVAGKLRESEERLSLVIKSVEDYAIITTDAEGIVNGWNPGAEKIFGYAESEIIGQIRRDFFYARRPRKRTFRRTKCKRRSNKGSAEDERFHLRKDGSRFYVSGMIHPLKDGKLHGFVKIARDMTERIEANKSNAKRKCCKSSSARRKTNENASPAICTTNSDSF